MKQQIVKTICQCILQKREGFLSSGESFHTETQQFLIITIQVKVQETKTEHKSMMVITCTMF